MNIITTVRGYQQGAVYHIMSSESQRPLVNGSANGYANGNIVKSGKAVEELNSELKVAAKNYQANFHGDELLADKQIMPTGTLLDIRDVFNWGNAKQIWDVLSKLVTGQGLDVSASPLKISAVSETRRTNAITDGIGLSAYRLFAGEQCEQSRLHPKSSHFKIQPDVAPSAYLSW